MLRFEPGVGGRVAQKRPLLWPMPPPSRQGRQEAILRGSNPLDTWLWQWSTDQKVKA